MGRPMFENLISKTDTIILKEQVTLQQIQDNLPEILQKLLSPLYEKFSFYEVSLDLIQNELKKMKRGYFLVHVAVLRNAL